ncbi:DUF3231 family protein [Metabacillus lacus]|uniref:DUF3231 family protein n=1 Tax=Metabacillus lacus TaxID=1983721 RepID=UPI0031B58424
MTFQQKTLTKRVLEYLINVADHPQAKEIMTSAKNEIDGYIILIESILLEEGAAVPVGFTEQDVHIGAEKLYDFHFDILFLRLLKEISMGLHTLHLNMSYRSDMIELYKDLSRFTQGVFTDCMDYLSEHSALSRPPLVTPEYSVEFVDSTKYLSGLNPFNQKRVLNTV